MIKELSSIVNHRGTIVKLSFLLNLCFIFYLSGELYVQRKPSEKLFSVQEESILSSRTLNSVRNHVSPEQEQFHSQGGVSTLTSVSSPLVPQPNSVISCPRYQSAYRMELRGKYWVLYNYIQAEKTFGYMNSITYTTHGDLSFLDNLEPLLKRWEGPLSLAIYAPGSDFDRTLRNIKYYRQCTDSSLVREYVSFHLFFDTTHMPSKHIRRYNEESFDCQKPLPKAKPFYKMKSGLDYPVNVARNVARIAATTHYIFPSDIELYPSPGLIPRFLDMIKRNDSLYLKSSKPKVFVNSIFEIRANHSLPETKSELIQLLKNETVVPFHHVLCSHCHRIPQAENWISHPIEDGMNITFIGKRHAPFQHWEPIYIGTNDEPFYDERLSWEGRSDKMTQGYVMCVHDYEFLILDNAFLIHRPGIKTSNGHNSKSMKKVSAQNNFIKKTIQNELNTLYGTRKGCEM